MDDHTHTTDSSQLLSGGKWFSIKLKLKKAPPSLLVSEQLLQVQHKHIEQRVIASGVEVDMIVLYLHKGWQLENKVLHMEITALTHSNDFWSGSRQETVDKGVLVDP